jgi:uncharacterized metal-binding protein YceD (DUF177 family)
MAEEPEFSRLISADAVQGRGREQRIEATPAERAAIARRLDLVALDRLEATVRLTPVRGGQMVRATGELAADVVQTCVVTLDPVPATVTDRFSALFAPASQVPDEDHEIELDMAEEDSPEPMEGGRIDIGELVTQHLSLALDPYPRRPDAEFEASAEGPEEDEPAPKLSPFAALERLKPGK